MRVKLYEQFDLDDLSDDDIFGEDKVNDDDISVGDDIELIDKKYVLYCGNFGERKFVDTHSLVYYTIYVVVNVLYLDGKKLIEIKEKYGKDFSGMELYYNPKNFIKIKK